MVMSPQTGTQPGHLRHRQLSPTSHYCRSSRLPASFADLIPDSTLPLAHTIDEIRGWTALTARFSAVHAAPPSGGHL